MSEVTITKDKILKAAEVCPEAKKVLEELFPEIFKAFVSGDMFFHLRQYAKCHALTPIEQKRLHRNLIEQQIDLFKNDYANFTYILAHLKNAHEYGLFNLNSGYQLFRNEVYIRKQGVGIIIPLETLDGLIKIRSGGGK